MIELLGGWDQIDLEGAIGILPRQFIVLFDASGETFSFAIKTLHLKGITLNDPCILVASFVQTAGDSDRLTGG
jgi:hypothetical protein